MFSNYGWLKVHWRKTAFSRVLYGTFLLRRTFTFSRSVPFGVLPLHSSRIPGLILSSGCCLCGVSYVLPVSMWVSSGFSGILRPPKNMLSGELAILSVNECALWWIGIQGVFPNHTRHSWDRLHIHCDRRNLVFKYWRIFYDSSIDII